MFGRKLDKKIKDALMKNKIEASREVGVPNGFNDKTNKFPATFNPDKQSVENLKSELAKNKVEFATDLTNLKQKNSIGKEQYKNLDSGTISKEKEKYIIKNQNKIW